MNAGEIQDFLTEHFHRPVTQLARTPVTIELQETVLTGGVPPVASCY